MKLSDLFIKLSLKKDGFDKGIDQAKSKTNAFGSAVKKIGGLVAGVFAIGAIKSFISKSLEAYNVQAQAEQQLLVALKGRKDAQNELIRQAQQLQQITLFGDEETIRAQALIAAFVKEKEQIKSIIPLVQDLATAKMMSLAGAADLVSKTLGSSTNALSRYGIEVNGAVGSSERLESLMHGLNNAFGGQAAAAAQAGTGAIKQLINTLGDLREEVGKTIVESKKFPAIIKTIEREAKSFVNAVIFSKTTAEVEALSSAEEELSRKTTALLGDIASNDRALGVWANTAKTSKKEIKELINTIIEARLVGDMGPEPFDVGGGDFEMPKFEEHIKTIGELKAETDALKNSLDDYGVTQKQEIQKTLKQIEANEKLIKSLTTLSETKISLNVGLFQDTSGLDSMSSELDSWAAENIVIDPGNVMIDPEPITKIGTEFGRMLSQSLESGIENSLVGLGEIIGEGIATGEWDNFGNAVLNVVGGFLKTMGAALIAYGVAMDAFKKAFSNPFVAIAAGIALVALGSTISSLGSSGPAGGYSGAGASGYSPGGSSASTAISGNVSFVLEGDKLVGAINNNSSKRRLTR